MAANKANLACGGITLARGISGMRSISRLAAPPFSYHLLSTAHAHSLLHAALFASAYAPCRERATLARRNV